MAGLHTPLCDQFGVEYPIFGFTHCRETVVAISKAGGFGVLGAAYFSPERAEEELAWIEKELAGRPFGVDVMIPSSSPSAETGMADGDLSALEKELAQTIPEKNWAFVESLLERFDIPKIPEGSDGPEKVFPLGPSIQAARRHIESAISHGASLIVSALGTPPADAVEAAHARGIMVGAMIGTPRHAEKQIAAGVDLVIAQGSEAAAHAGDISTMVLLPQIVDLAAPRPVLAAGGIGTGRQLLAARAMGAQGAWMGSIWRVVSESNEADGVIAKLIAADSMATVRSRSYSGKRLRQLRTAWTEAWDGTDAPEPLPMPLQNILVAEAIRRIEYHQRWDLLMSPIGQVVGQLGVSRPTADVIGTLVQEYEFAAQQLLGQNG